MRDREVLTRGNLKIGLQPITATMAFNHMVRQTQAHREHGRRMDFPSGGPVGDFPKIFSKGGSKVVKIAFTPRNWKNNLFLLIISKSRGPRPSCPPFRRPWPGVFCMEVVAVFAWIFCNFPDSWHQQWPMFFVQSVWELFHNCRVLNEQGWGWINSC